MSAYEKNLIYVKCLGEVCHCYPDAVGNMPCDNGMLCDRCMDNPFLDEVYQFRLEEYENNQ